MRRFWASLSLKVEVGLCFFLGSLRTCKKIHFYADLYDNHSQLSSESGGRRRADTGFLRASRIGKWVCYDRER